MSSKLSIDILSIIFEDLEQENDKTLYSCIFVNREWCQVAIPFLWKNPWKKFHENQQTNRYEILFKCCLMMISKESKDLLKMNGIELLIEDFSSSQMPLFNYASFCKVIDSSKVHDMIRTCLTIDYHQYLAEQEIFKLLIGSTSKLKILMLCHKSNLIPFFPNSSISLSQLNELHCKTSMDSTIFYGLSQLCRNVERLVIEGHNDDNFGLILFIKQQVNLKRVKIWEAFNYGYLAQGQCKNLGEALATKSSSIIELDIGDDVITIPPMLLKEFQNNLIIFKFGIDESLINRRLFNELENTLEDISLPNLQQLIIYDCFSDIALKIIEKTNGELKKINVGFCYEDVLVSIISKHCPKLELLIIWAGDENKILELIKKCKKLRGLALRYLGRQNIGELFKILYTNASNQLRKLQLNGSWELPKKALNEFFENWNKQQRNSLDFYISSNIIIEEEDKRIIKKYQEIGVIRKFEQYTEDITICVDKLGYLYS